MSGPSRRIVLGGIAAASLAGASKLSAQPIGGADFVPLWPGKVPGAPAAPPVRRVEDQSSDPGAPDRWVRGLSAPALVVRRAARPNGAAVLICPGGGYEFLSYDNEGEEQARWLNALGITAFILLYRLPGEGWTNRATTPLSDAQRAVRVIRSRASQFGVDPKRVAVLGFSAGGHLAGSLATRHAEPVYTAVDAADRLSARPDFAGLIYPVVSMAAPFTHAGSRDTLLGTDAPEDIRRAASVDLRVTADTPPIFLAQASDDTVVPIENSLALYSAMLAAKLPAELHAFDAGGHGFGVRLSKDHPASAWPTLFAAYATRRGIIPA